MVYTHALLSRPEPQLTELANGIRVAHLNPVGMPAFTFAATGETVAPDKAWREHPSRLLVFTSPRAVEFGLPVVPASMLRESHIASVGPATTRALAAAGTRSAAGAGAGVRQRFPAGLCEG